MEDYSGFYFNVYGKYEDLVYYISPIPEQKLYMIRKYNEMVDTNKILKSIETGFNGYDYEVYSVQLCSFPLQIEATDDEWACAVMFTDFSNKQEFKGYILFTETMPLFDQFFKYILENTSELPSLKYPEFTPKQTQKKPVPKVEPPVAHQQVARQTISQQQIQAQQNARVIASQIVQNNDQNNNNQ